MPGLDLSLSVQHGNELGFGFTSFFDSKAEPPRREPYNFVSSYYLPPSKLPNQINKNSWYDRLLYDVERSGLLLIEGSISPDGNSAKLVVGNTEHALWSDAIGLHTALADLHLPATVRSIFFVVEEAGHRTVTLNVPRPSTSFPGNPRTNIRRINILSGRTDSSPQYRTGFATKKVNTIVNLRSRFQLFDPDDPARYQIYADIASEFALNNHWAIRSSLALNLEQNFDESKRQKSDSVLPKVRSEVVRYLIEGDSGLERLILEGRDTIGRSLHYRAFGGYLEQMYAGIGVKFFIGHTNRAWHLEQVWRTPNSATLTGDLVCVTIKWSLGTSQLTGLVLFLITILQFMRAITSPKISVQHSKLEEHSEMAGKLAFGQPLPTFRLKILGKGLLTKECIFRSR